LAGNLIGNKSFGKVSIKTQNKNASKKTRIGGLVGRCNVAGLTFDNCAVSAKIGTTSDSVSENNNVGMICGLVNQAVKSGTSGTIYVFGTRTLNGTETALTADNYMDYIDGSNNGKLNALTVVFENKKQ
jgi:hypothetical protein